MINCFDIIVFLSLNLFLWIYILYYFVVSCKSFWLVAIFEVRFYIQSRARLRTWTKWWSLIIQHALTKYNFYPIKFILFFWQCNAYVKIFYFWQNCSILFIIKYWNQELRTFVNFNFEFYAFQLQKIIWNQMSRIVLTIVERKCILAHEHLYLTNTNRSGPICNVRDFAINIFLQSWVLS